MKKSQFLMIIGSGLLLLVFVFPIWRITLQAPQYPDPIGMDIWINKIADYHENDIKNINLMNHYVGMKYIPKEMKEFEVFPAVAIGMAILGIVIGFFKNNKLYLAWSILLLVLGSIAVYDFYLWEYEYGHNLDPTAAIKIPGQGYQPPLIGRKEILNFVAISFPLLGSAAIAGSVLTTFYSFFVAKKEQKR